MDNTEREKVGLWRFSLIAPAFHGTHGFPSNRAFFRSLEDKEFEHPVTGEKVKFKAGTFDVWLSSYKRKGIDGLIPQQRSDVGKSRMLSEEAQSRIIELREQYPRIINVVVREKLIIEGLIRQGVSQSTIDRFIRSLGSDPLEEYHQGKERKAFEMKYANQCWQADTSYLYKLDGRQTYLIEILDDASRMVVGHEIVFEDSAVTFQKVFKDAVAKYGVPDILYVDNGSPYANHQLAMICARLGTQLSHTPVRDGSAKGKVEKSFRFHKDHFLRCNDWDAYKSLDDVNEAFDTYLYGTYVNECHGSTATDDKGRLLSARQRFLMDAERFKYIESAELDQIFLHRHIRKVRTDSTIRFDSDFYEVPFQYMKMKVEFVIDPNDKSRAWIDAGDGLGLIPVRKVNKVENRSVKRKQHMDFTKEVE